jgi:adenosine/AMP kinase
LLKNAYPMNFVNTIRQVPEVCTIHCATENPVEVIVAETEQGVLSALLMGFLLKV